MPDSPLCVSCRQRPAEPSWRPFCSERCKTIDLGRWLSGDYRVAADRSDEATKPVDAEGDGDESPDRSIDR